MPPKKKAAKKKATARKQAPLVEAAKNKESKPIEAEPEVVDAEIVETPDLSDEQALAPIEEPTNLAEWKAHYDLKSARIKALEKYLDDNLVEGKHFGVVKGISHKFLWKGGGEIVCKCLHLVPEFKQTHKEIDISTGFVLYSYICRLYLTLENGECVKVAELEASANSFEGKFRKHSGKERSAKDLIGEIHNVMTRSEKRAYVGAAIQAGALSSRYSFAEDLVTPQEPGPPCPKCKDGELKQRKRKSDGKPFWGCTNFFVKDKDDNPKCEHIENEDPRGKVKIAKDPKPATGEHRSLDPKWTPKCPKCKKPSLVVNRDNELHFSHRLMAQYAVCPNGCRDDDGVPTCEFRPFCKSCEEPLEIMDRDEWLCRCENKKCKSLNKGVTFHDR